MCGLGREEEKGGGGGIAPTIDPSGTYVKSWKMTRAGWKGTSVDPRLCWASQSNTVSTSAGVDPPHTSELRMDDSSKTRMQYGSLSYLCGGQCCMGP